MSLDPFLRLNSERVQTSPGASNYASLMNGFSGVRIKPECLRIGTDGSVRVRVSASAQEWFATLHQLGETLQLTRNRMAVLGQIGSVPPLTDWRNTLLPRDAFGLFTPNLAEYASLWAVREWSGEQLIYSLEARDVRGNTFQKAVLTDAARHDLFERFIADHQSAAGNPSPWFSANHAWSQRRHSSITGRIPLLRSKLYQKTGEVRRLAQEVLPRLLLASTQSGCPLRTTLYDRPFIGGAVWTPEALDATGDSSEAGIRFLHGGNIGLHLDLNHVASVWLWTGKCWCCGDQRWAVELGDAHDRIGVAISAGSDLFEADWRSLLLSVIL